MKNYKIFPLLLVAITTTLIAGNNTYENLLPEQFSNDVFIHITNLAKIGPRPTGSKNELKAARYIKKEFDKIGITSNIEYFEYKSFEFSNIDFKVGSDHFKTTGLGFIPYQNINHFSGTAVLVNLNDSTNDYNIEDIAGNAIISNDYKSHFQLLRLNPSIIIYVDLTEFNKIALINDMDYSLTVTGSYSKIKSPTVVAQLGNNINNNEIIIGSHLDSYRDSPGASDNGSGIGVMLELAKYFKGMEDKIKGKIKFISFGSEEVGILGSRRYVQTHSLDDCVLFYNIDDVGGNGLGAIETKGGVVKKPQVLKDDLSVTMSQNPWEGVNSYWRILPTQYLMGYILTVNHPDWLVDVTHKAVSNSRYSINYVENLGADGMSFAHAGIPSTTIGITGDKPHTPFDDVDIINKNSLLKAGEISARVITQTLKRFNMLEKIKHD